MELPKGYTPGPWRDGQDGNLRVYGPDCMGEHSGLVATVFKARANARLIALAPDMAAWIEGEAARTSEAVAAARREGLEQAEAKVEAMRAKSSARFETNKDAKPARRERINVRTKTLCDVLFAIRAMKDEQP